MNLFCSLFLTFRDYRSSDFLLFLEINHDQERKHFQIGFHLFIFHFGLKESFTFHTILPTLAPRVSVVVMQFVNLFFYFLLYSLTINSSTHKGCFSQNFISLTNFRYSCLLSFYVLNLKSVLIYPSIEPTILLVLSFIITHP